MTLSGLRGWRDVWLVTTPPWIWPLPIVAIGVILVALILATTFTGDTELGAIPGKDGSEIRVAPEPEIFATILTEEADAVRRFDMVRNPLAPPPPPAQAATPPEKGMFSIRGVSSRETFGVATRGLNGIASPGARPNLDADGCALGELRAAAGNLATLHDSDDPRWGMFNYHLGIAALCNRRWVEAKGFFTESRTHFSSLREQYGDRYHKALRPTSGRADLARLREIYRWSFQYELASGYGLALAAAEWPRGGKSPKYQEGEEALRVAQDAAVQVVSREPSLGGAGRYVNFNSSAFDLLDFSTAHILSARVWLALRQTDTLRNADKDLTDRVSDGLPRAETLCHPALAANAAVFAIVAQRAAAGELRAFAGDPVGVVALHRAYLANPAAPIRSDPDDDPRGARAARDLLCGDARRPAPDHIPSERVRAMAAIAGADFTADNAAAPNRSVPYPRFALIVDPAKTRTDYDADRMDRWLYLRAMKAGLRDGSVKSILDANTGLASISGTSEGFGQVAHELMTRLQSSLVNEAKRLRDGGKRDHADRIERWLARDAPSAGAGSWSASLRLTFGDVWSWWAVGWVLLLVLSLWASHAGWRLRRGWDSLFEGRHHRKPDADGKLPPRTISARVRGAA